MAGRSPGNAFKRANPRRKGRQVELANQLPNRPDRMIFFHQPLDIQHLPAKLAAIRLHQSNGSAPR